MGRVGGEDDLRGRLTGAGKPVVRTRRRLDRPEHSPRADVEGLDSFAARELADAGAESRAQGVKPPGTHKSDGSQVSAPSIWRQTTTLPVWPRENAFTGARDSKSSFGMHEKSIELTNSPA